MLSPCPSLMSEGELLSESYDVREEWPICMEEIMVQGNCSSAYAITAAQSLSERLCI